LIRVRYEVLYTKLKRILVFVFTILILFTLANYLIKVNSVRFIKTSNTEDLNYREEEYQIWQINQPKIYVSSCTEINTPGYDILARDLYGTMPGKYYCVSIASSNVVLDGNGYTLIGGVSGGGISVIGRENITIKNIKIYGYEVGIDLLYTHNSIIHGCYIENSKVGILLRISSSAKIYNNRFVNSGLYLYLSYRNSIYNNTVNGMPLIYLELLVLCLKMLYVV